MGRPAVLKVDIVADARKVGGGVNEAGSKLGKLGSIGKKVGLAVGAGLAVAGVAAGKFALDSIKSASDVQQAYGALDTVFGKNSARVKKWAEGAADSVGLAKGEYANLAALVGSQLQGMGFAQDKSAGKSKNLIKMGADLAATYGGTVSDAVQAVSSVLKGETDPIERYGVSIKQADVNARLASMGLDGLTGKAAKQAQAQAVLSLLTEQTTKAQGAFGRESNTLAGQQERLKAKFENIKATIGQKLLPVATRLVTWVNKMLSGSGGLRKRLAPLGTAFAAVGRFITTKVVPAARMFVQWYVEKIVPGLKRALTPILNGVRSAFNNVAAAVQRNKPQLLQLLNTARRLYEFYARHLAPVVGKVLGAALKFAGFWLGTTIDMLGRLIRAVSTAVGWVRSLVGWLNSIHVPSLSGLGKLKGLIGGSVANLTGGVAGLTGGAPSYDRRRGLSTAGLVTAAGGVMGALSGGGAASLSVTPTIVDARTYIDVDGALDEVAVARKLERLLLDHGRRLGRQVAGLAT